jgi:hypothetical protein
VCGEQDGIMTTLPNNEDDGYIDITQLIKRCASESLSYSHPFTPLVPRCSLPISPRTTDKNHNGAEDEEQGTIDDTALSKMNGLHIQGTSLPITSGDEGPNPKDDRKHHSPELTPIDMRDAMTALELGDKRMDCCEIPITSSCSSSGNDDTSSSSLSQHATIPPRIAPISLSDGTRSSPLSSSVSFQPNSSHNASSSSSSPYMPLQLPSSPCPSLLPYWETLSISSSSSSNQLLSLLLLQLTSLEAYIGTNNGGSNACETIYCMLWCHDGILIDMRDRLIVSTGDNSNDTDPKTGTNSSPLDERTVAQWILFASSLGIIRIAEAVRSAVVNADIYEEEDFGVSLHDGPELDTNVGGINDGKSSPSQVSSCTMRFCTSLKQEKTIDDSISSESSPMYQADVYIDTIWDTALRHLCDYSSSLTGRDAQHQDDLHALEIILRLQQSLYHSICRLSELNDQNVTDFTHEAKNRSRETVKLLNELRSNKTIASLTSAGSKLVETDGRLCSLGDERVDTLLHASFDPFVNRRLLGNAPIRKARFCNPLQVIDSLSLVTSELEWAVCDVILKGNTLGRIIRMLENNSSRGIGGAVPSSVADKKPNDKDADLPFGMSGLAINNPVGINILSRSLMLLNLYFDDKLLGQYDFPDMIGKNCAS